VKAFRLIVSGRVQGVSYRAYVERNMSALPVTGYVKNLPDGDVEILAEADEGFFIQIESIAKEGSPFSRVENIRIETICPAGVYADFSIDY